MKFKLQSELETTKITAIQLERAKTSLFERVEAFERKATLNMTEMTMPSNVNVKQIDITERSHDTNQHMSFKLFIAQVFRDGKKSDMETLCQELANKIKKSVHLKPKPDAPVLVAIIPSSTYSLDAKTRDQYGAYYEYQLKSKHIIAVKMCNTEDETRHKET